MRMILHRFLFVVVACLCFYFTLRSTSTTGTTQQQYTLEPQADSIHFVHVSKKTQESNKQSTTNGLVCQQQRQQQTNDNTMTTKRLALLRPLKHSWSRLVDAFQIILRPRSFGGLIVRDVTPPCRNLQFHVRANSYTLHEPLDFELGAPCKYATDYAYTPVTLQSVGAAQESKTTKEDAQQQGVLIQENLQQQQWWQWWLPRSSSTDDHYYYYPFNNNKKKYTINKRAFAGGSHGQVWKGVDQTNQALIFKRLHLERGLDILEAGLREVHFGQWLAQVDARGSLFTTYVDHFFRESSGSAAAATVELWIVFKDAGTSLRGLLYEAVGVGDFVVFQPSALWVEIRMSVSALQESTSLEQVPAADHHTHERNNMHVWAIGRKLMSQVLRSILQAAALLHANGIAHRDIKPGNVMCQPNFNVDDLLSGRYAEQEAIDALAMNCVLGDLSSAWDKYSDESLYTRRPSRLEQTDDYAPPEAIFGYLYNQTSTIIDPSFDSWSTGILALEMLLGTPNVFSVDQRTTAVLTHQMKKEGASDADIQRALYLAALSQFCIYNPTSTRHHGWPLRDDDPLPYPLHNYSMVKHTCTLHDFHRGLLARDPLGLGFDSSADTLLHLIWQLLNWDPNERMTASEALAHPYFTRVDTRPENLPNENTALESQMLDPRMDFNLSDTVDEYHCPKCQRIFDDWNSCLLHTTSRKHGKFCSYDKRSLPTCLHAHSMLPAHSSSGYCDIQGRRRVIEDFHAIHLSSTLLFYAIFDGHTGNLASKYAASFLYDKLESRLATLLLDEPRQENWKDQVEQHVRVAFYELHDEFLVATKFRTRTMDQSGTTATAAIVAPNAVMIASLGDSRAVLSSRNAQGEVAAIQLTTDHVASNTVEQDLVKARGGTIVYHNGVDRVNGSLAITRSIGDASLSPFLSREADVLTFTRSEIKHQCGDDGLIPCFLILASDGLWDMLSNQEAVDMALEYMQSDEDGSLQQAAEALTLEAYVRGSRDNIGVAVIAID